MISRWICNIASNANAFDKVGGPHDALIDRFEALSMDGSLTLVVPGGVRDEVEHPNTPPWIKSIVADKIFNLRPGLNQSRRASRLRVEEILRGNAKPGHHAADASHVSEAAEIACPYFIIQDKRILAKREELRRVLGAVPAIMALEELFEILGQFPQVRK
jgi:hypothetical protein